MKRIIIGTLVAAGLSAPAFAAEPDRAYFAFDYGITTLQDANFAGPFANLTFPNPGTLRFSGGMNVSPNLGFEVGYSIIGSSTVDTAFTTDTLDKATSLQLLAVGYMPVSPEFEIFGKLGFASNRYTWTYTDWTIPATIVTDYSNTSLAFGFGAKFDIMPDMSVQAQYLNLGAFDSLAPPLKVSTMTIGMSFIF